MRLTIIFLTACCISFFSYATQCKKCNSEANNCRCVTTVTDLQNTANCTHHAGSSKTPSLDGPNHQKSPVQDTTRAKGQVAGSFVIVPGEQAGGSVTFTVGSPPAGATASSSYGCCVNRKKEERQPFSGEGCSLQTPSSQNSDESAQHSDILGIIDQLSDFHINSATEEQAQTLTAINNAFTAALNLENTTDNQQTRESLLNVNLQTSGYQLSPVEIANTNTFTHQLRILMDSGNIVYLVSGNEHYIFTPGNRGRIFMVSYFALLPSNTEYQNITKSGPSHRLNNINSSNSQSLRLYIIKPSEANYQSM